VKGVLKHSMAQGALAWLIAAYSRAVFRTTRWTRVNEDPLRARVQAGQPIIVCFWHGRMILMPNFWDFAMPIYMLGSPHRDGQLILRTLRRFGVLSITGSSSKHGARALREMARAIANGNAVGITPDGPRGPRMRVAPGATALARATGAPIFPATISLEHGRTLRSWDRFLFALPFGRGVLIVGDPVSVPPDADDQALEAARLELERRLNGITFEADRRCHRVPVEPAPLATPAADRRVA
jgi:lysophospholipid acyltransferase (LPLAT)-like uncharacterized protein